MSKILFIDDEITLNLPLVEKLESEGWVVEFVQTIHEGLDRLENYDFDIMLLDIMLDATGIAERFGYSSFRRTQYGYSTGIVMIDYFIKIKPIPILLTSARDDSKSQVDPLISSKKVIDFFPKPLDESKLLLSLKPYKK